HQGPDASLAAGVREYSPRHGYDTRIKLSYSGLRLGETQGGHPIMSTQDRRTEPAQDRTETRIQFRAGEQLFAFLALRALRMGTPSADLQARAEIEIWRSVMDAELRRIPLTLAEATCLAGILKGHPL